MGPGGGEARAADGRRAEIGVRDKTRLSERVLGGKIPLSTTGLLHLHEWLKDNSTTDQNDKWFETEICVIDEIGQREVEMGYIVVYPRRSSWNSPD